MSSIPSESSAPATPMDRVKHSAWGRRVFLGFLGIIGLLYAGLVVYHAYLIAHPAQVPFAPPMGLLEECRLVCMKYGLLSTGHLKHDAQAYLAKAGSRKLSEGLASILNDHTFSPAATQRHPLLNCQAPDFELRDVNGQTQTLSSIRGEGPAIVVFYYGYGCSHCVAQLFGLDQDRRHFEELGVPIIAISSDMPEHTREKYQEYGRFTFPVMSDPDNAVAQKYGTFSPATPSQPERQVHGTFMISPEGTVEWVNTGNEPFIDNKTLLLRMAEVIGAWSPMPGSSM